MAYNPNKLNKEVDKMYIEQVLSVIEEIDSEVAEEFKKGIEGESFTLPNYGLMHDFLRSFLSKHRLLRG